MIDKCPQCKGEKFIRDEQVGEVICVNCGLVTEEIINLGGEYRYYGLEDKSRLRAKVIDDRVSDRGFGTKIQFGGKDASGGAMSEEQRRINKRMNYHQRRTTQDGVGRNLKIAAGEMSRIVPLLQIPKHVHREAIRIYRKALYARLVRGRTILGVSMAALYAACRLNQHPITLNQLSKASGHMKGDIARCYRLLHVKLNLKPDAPKVKPYMAKVIAILDISGEVELKAIELHDEFIETKMHQGKDAKGLTAAFLYIACNHYGFRVTQKTLADAAGVTEVTLRNRYKEICEVLRITKDGYKIDRK